MVLMGGFRANLGKWWATMLGGGVSKCVKPLSNIRKKAFLLRDQPPADWDFEIDIRPQFFGLMESDFWEPKAVEPFAPISTASSGDSEWISEILNSVGEPLDLNKVPGAGE